MDVSYPPTIAPGWPTADRLRYCAWLASISLARIDGDDPTVPLLSKRPVRALFAAIHAVASFPPAVLEDNRANLEKPFDPAGNYDGVKLPPEWLDILRNLDPGEG